MHRLFQPITSLKYVAQKRAKLYDKLDITTPYDLLYHLPVIIWTTEIPFRLQKHKIKRSPFFGFRFCKNSLRNSSAVV